MCVVKFGVVVALHIQAEGGAGLDWNLGCAAPLYKCQAQCILIPVGCRILPVAIVDLCFLLVPSPQPPYRGGAEVGLLHPSFSLSSNGSKTSLALIVHPLTP